MKERETGDDDDDDDDDKSFKAVLIFFGWCITV